MLRNSCIHSFSQVSLKLVNASTNMKPCSTIKHKSGKGMPKLLRCICAKSMFTLTKSRFCASSAYEYSYTHFSSKFHTFFLKIHSNWFNYGQQ